MIGMCYSLEWELVVGKEYSIENCYEILDPLRNMVKKPSDHIQDLVTITVLSFAIHMIAHLDWEI